MKIRKKIIIWQFIWFLFIGLAAGLGFLTAAVIKNGREDQIGGMVFFVSLCVLMFAWSSMNLFLFNKWTETSENILKKWASVERGVEWVEFDVEKLKYIVLFPFPFLSHLAMYELKRKFEKDMHKDGEKN